MTAPIDTSPRPAPSEPAETTATTAIDATPPAAPDGGATRSFTPPKMTPENLKVALVGLVVLVAAVLAFGALAGGTDERGGGTSADIGALSVIAEDIVTSAKDQGGAIDAIGGYLPGTGMVLTVQLADLGTDGTHAGRGRAP